MATTWDKVSLVPLTLVKGTEGVFADKAVARIIELARIADPEVEITRLDAANYEASSLGYLASPSLFGEARAIIAEQGENMNDAFLADALEYLAAPATDVWFVLRHGGGVRGKKLLDEFTKRGEVVVCDPLKRDADKQSFVLAELRRHGRNTEKAAVETLIDALGSDLRELDAAIRQLVSDTEGNVTLDVVNRYYGGRMEATGFAVADAAIAGNTQEAVSLARFALASGTSPVPLVAALAAKLRLLVKVGAARGRGATAASLGIAPWQFDRAQRELRGWTPEALAESITAVATCDAEVKGGSRDPEYAVERALLIVAAARNRGRG